MLSSVCTEAVQRAVLKARNLHVLIVGDCNVLQASHPNNLAILEKRLYRKPCSADTADAVQCSAVQTEQTQCRQCRRSAGLAQTQQTVQTQCSADGVQCRRSAVYTVQCVEQTKCRAVQPQRGQWVVRVVRGAT